MFIYAIVDVSSATYASFANDLLTGLLGPY